MGLPFRCRLPPRDLPDGVESIAAGEGASYQINFHVQLDVTGHTRGVLVDWMRGVCSEHRISERAFQLSVSYLDCFLTCHIVPRQHFQCLGATCLHMATKNVLRDDGKLPLRRASELCVGHGPEALVQEFESCLLSTFQAKSPQPLLIDSMGTFTLEEGLEMVLCSQFCDMVLCDPFTTAMDRTYLASHIRVLARMTHEAWCNGTQILECPPEVDSLVFKAIITPPREYMSHLHGSTAHIIDSALKRL